MQKGNWSIIQTADGWCYVAPDGTVSDAYITRAAAVMAAFEACVEARARRSR
jgi:hypothetical protein